MSALAIVSTAPKAKGVNVDEYSVDIIGERFRQAARTAYRLPAARVQGYVSYWPEIKRSPTERLALEERKYFQMPPSPQEIAEMLEVMRWVQWLDVEQRKLVWMRARRYGWRDIGLRFGYCSRTAQRHWQYAMLQVMQHLDR